MSESITERAQNIVNGGRSTTYPSIGSAQYVRHTMGELLAELTRLQRANAALVEEKTGLKQWIASMRLKHGRRDGSTYEQGQWDMAARIEMHLSALASQ